MLSNLIIIFSGIACLGFGVLSTILKWEITLGKFPLSAALLFVPAGLILMLVYFNRAYKSKNEKIARIIEDYKPKDEKIALFMKDYELSYQKIHNFMKTWNFVIPYILILGIGVGIGFVLFIFIKPVSGSSTDYNFFKDLLTTTLAIISLFIALTGALIYAIIKNHLSQIVKKESDERFNFVSANLETGISYLFWVQYENAKDDVIKGKKHLEMAIHFANKAHENYQKLENKNSRKSIELACNIRNNLGYYLAERGTEEDKSCALECSSYIKGHILRYPNRIHEWHDTINFIEEKCSCTTTL